MSETDVVIIGGGHNGLVCAFYLASAGLKVAVFERNAEVGGAAVTETFHPGFRNSAASYAVSLLHSKVISDMELSRHGLTIVERKMSNFLPLDDRRSLAMGPGLTKAAVAKFSQADAERLEAYGERLEAVARFVRGLLLQSPPSFAGRSRLSGVRDLVTTGRMARKAAALDLIARRDLAALFSQSAGHWLDGWFESDPIKAAFGFDGIVGTYASPYAAGTAYVLLHHVLGEVNGRKGLWGHAIGGMGAITQAMSAACLEKGVALRTNEDVQEVIVEKGRAVGIATSRGERVAARLVVSNLNPRLLFERLVDPGELSADFRERIRRYRCGSGVFRMNLALSEAPRFACLPEAGDHLTAGIIIAPSLAYMDRAWSEAHQFGWSRAPIIEMLIPSTLDETLAPRGAHVASLFCQHAAPDLPGGETWDLHREEVADLMIATVEALAPGFARSVVARSVLSPLDLERRFGLVAGDIFHGQMSLDQLFSARPVLGHGDYRAPIRGLYM
ncbi:MAG: phytoene desaturase family protein, partial [Caulobacteraceae bacterium]